MTTAALPRVRRSLLGKLAVAAVARQRTRSAAGRLAAAAAKAREHVVTFAALASVDIGAFHICAAAGWIVTGLSLLALDFAVRG